jgi:hypothetical protein
MFMLSHDSPIATGTINASVLPIAPVREPEREPERQGCVEALDASPVISEISGNKWRDALQSKKPSFIRLTT